MEDSDCTKTKPSRVSDSDKRLTPTVISQSTDKIRLPTTVPSRQNSEREKFALEQYKLHMAMLMQIYQMNLSMNVAFITVNVAICASVGYVLTQPAFHNTRSFAFSALAIVGMAACYIWLVLQRRYISWQQAKERALALLEKNCQSECKDLWDDGSPENINRLAKNLPEAACIGNNLEKNFPGIAGIAYLVCFLLYGIGFIKL